MRAARKELHRAPNATRKAAQITHQYLAPESLAPQDDLELRNVLCAALLTDALHAAPKALELVQVLERRLPLGSKLAFCVRELWEDSFVYVQNLYPSSL